ncbi:hypothetical protein NDU88_003992 [Pleurodeles waltl]|uniref:Uncharacterized protein n=1 Tax=Pleurodeles waltl TaxID=8319 RepID=A0AAV7PCQ9_PLEWA|nr:hypothetical protein NDU88_003992 [Pleurodeles waltl]
MNVSMVCLADQCISCVNAKYPESVHDAFVLRNGSIPNVMGQLQRLRVANRCHVPFLLEEEAGDARVAAVDLVDSEDEEAEDEDEDNKTSVI